MATFSLTGSLRLSPTWSDSLGASTLADATTFLASFALENGTSAGEADCYWRDVRTLAASTFEFLNLSSLPLNVLGGSGTLDIASLKLIYVRNLSASVTLQYEFEGASSIPELPPGGVFLWSSATAASTGNAWTYGGENGIQVRNNGGASANYEILLIGVRAT